MHQLFIYFIFISLDNLHHPAYWSIPIIFPLKGILFLLFGGEGGMEDTDTELIIYIRSKNCFSSLLGEPQNVPLYMPNHSKELEKFMVDNFTEDY